MIRNFDTKAVGRPMEILLIEDDLEDAGMTIALLKPIDREHFVSMVKSLRKYMLSDVLLPQ